MLTALNEQKRRSVLAADHAAVDADVHHPGLGVLRDNGGKRVDIPAAFAEVPFWNWKFGLIDSIATNYDVLDGAGTHDIRCNGLAVLFHHVLDQLAIRRIPGKAKSQRQPRTRAEAADEQFGATAGRVAFDVLEKQRRALFLENTPGYCADLSVPIYFHRDAPQFTVLREARHPLPLIHKTHHVPSCNVGMTHRCDNHKASAINRNNGLRRDQRSGFHVCNSSGAFAFPRSRVLASITAKRRPAVSGRSRAQISAIRMHDPPIRMPFKMWPPRPAAITETR